MLSLNCQNISSGQSTRFWKISILEKPTVKSSLKINISEKGSQHWKHQVTIIHHKHQFSPLGVHFTRSPVVSRHFPEDLKTAIRITSLQIETGTGSSRTRVWCLSHINPHWHEISILRFGENAVDDSNSVFCFPRL